LPPAALPPLDEKLENNRRTLSEPQAGQRSLSDRAESTNLSNTRPHF
jgi:hypothetical protein